MGLHVIILRQFIGATSIITFASQIISSFAPSIATYMALILNLVQFLSNLFTVVFVRAGRRPILMTGTAGMALCSLGIGVVLIYQVEVPILVLMTIFMGFNGACILAVGWGYPS
jgi:MFS family permease